MKQSLLWVLDRVVIPVASGAVFVRLGNFFNSEIIGNETKSSFGIQFVQDYYSKRDAVEITKIAEPRKAYQALTSSPEYAQFLEKVPAKHPSQLYEAVMYVLVFAILMFLYWKTDVRKKEGFLFGVFMVLLWSVRFGVEFVKESQGGFEKYTLFNGLSTGQWLSIPFIIIGLYYIFRKTKPIT